MGRHGHTKNGKTSLEYQSWSHMKQRCQNPGNVGYYNYGGRGIRVCKRWQSFENFLADMGVRPDGLTLERIDNDGNYEPDNCKWATRHIQRINSRSISCGPYKQYWFRAWHKDYMCQFTSNNQNEFARQHGLDVGNVSHCLNGKQKTCKGWTFKRSDHE